MGVCGVQKECKSVERNNIIYQKYYKDNNNISEISSCSDKNFCRVKEEKEIINEFPSGPILQLLIQKNHNNKFIKKNNDNDKDIKI
jgi:hypothetical protein